MFLVLHFLLSFACLIYTIFYFSIKDLSYYLSRFDNIAREASSKEKLNTLDRR